jgi:hypothetical protein
MRPRVLVMLLFPLALTACAAEAPPPPLAPARAIERPALPPRGHLSTSADRFAGPRVVTERTHGRPLTIYGDTDARSRLLVAGCVNGRRCAGTDVVHAATVGCPPTDAEVWFFPTLGPRGADIDATPAHPGAAAWRQAVADLRPRFAVVFRTGPTPRVRAAGPDLAAARRFARIAGLPFSRESATQGLAAWTSAIRPRTTSITVELVGERASARRAVRLAYALDRLAGTRFAAAALAERMLMLRHGQDPRM